MKKIIVALFVSYVSIAQSTKSWKTTPLEKGQTMVGVGVTLYGVTAKSGYFIKNNLCLGVFAEKSMLLSFKKEIGIYGRQYLKNGFISPFVEGYISYGKFTEYDLLIDEDEHLFAGTTPRVPYDLSSPKISLGLGSELALSKRWSLEGQLKFGKLTNADWWQPGLHLSLNHHFRK